MTVVFSIIITWICLILWFAVSIYLFSLILLTLHKKFNFPLRIFRRELQICSHLLKKSFMEIFSFFVQWDICFIRTLLINIENQCNCEALLQRHSPLHHSLVNPRFCFMYLLFYFRYEIFSAIIFVLSITISWLQVVFTLYSCKIIPQQLLMSLKEHVRFFSFSCNTTMQVWHRDY